MKKFYALVLAAMTVTGASAFETMDLALQAKAGHELQTLNTSAMKAEAPTSLNKAKAYSAEGASSADQLAGYYWQTTWINSGGSLAKRTVGYTEVTSDGDNVKIDGLYYSVTPFTGVFDAASQTITIPVDQVCTVLDEDSEGNTVELKFSVYEIIWPADNGGSFGKAPVVLDYDSATGTISYARIDADGYYETCFVIAEAGADAGTAVYGQIYELELKLFDALMSTTSTASATSTANYYPIKVSQDGASLAISNFCGWGDENVVTLTLDKASMTASAIDQTVSIRVSAGTSSFAATCDVMSVADDTFNDNTVVFEATVDDYGDVTLTAPVLGWCITSPEAYAGNGNFVYNPSIQLLYNPFDQLTAIEAISINESAAPVEYFNLQGVRVANPENGLYIRRQGNTATKVLVK